MTSDEAYGRILRELADAKSDRDAIRQEQHNQRLMLVRIEGFIERNEERIKANKSDITELKRAGETGRHEALRLAKVEAERGNMQGVELRRGVVLLLVGSALAGVGWLLVRVLTG